MTKELTTEEKKELRGILRNKVALNKDHVSPEMRRAYASDKKYQKNVRRLEKQTPLLESILGKLK